MPSPSGGSGPMSWKACESAWRRGWRCTIYVCGSASNLVVLGWLSLICWSGDLNSHQAFNYRPVWECARPMQRGAFAATESLSADITAASLGLARVDLDVAFADLPGCRTGGIGTECGVRVHAVPSGLVVGRILLGPASDCPNLTAKRTPTLTTNLVEYWYQHWCDVRLLRGS